MESRRSILRGLAALPLATVPAAASSSPDAVLIAYATEVEALANRHAAAVMRFCDLDGRCDGLRPQRPVPPPSRSKYITEMEGSLAEGDVTIRRRRAPPDPASEHAEAQHAAAMQAWEAERDAIQERLGLPAADELQHRLYGDLELAVDVLASTVPTTWAGLAAKARAAVALDPHADGSLNDWEYDLMVAVLRDAVRIGGVA